MVCFATLSQFIYNYRSMYEAYEKYYRRLASNNISNTRPRKAVFTALLNSGHTPLSSAELIKLCTPQADRASVYRSIEKLEAAGIIKKVYHGWKYKLELSDEFHGHHHHLFCVECGEIIATSGNTALEAQINAVAETAGYKITGHQLEIQGICPQCAT